MSALYTTQLFDLPPTSNKVEPIYKKLQASKANSRYFSNYSLKYCNFHASRNKRQIFMSGHENTANICNLWWVLYQGSYANFGIQNPDFSWPKNLFILTFKNLENGPETGFDYKTLPYTIV